MFLAVDIGNTTIHNGIFKAGVLRKVFNIPTYTTGLDRQYIKKLGASLRKIRAVIIVSVVPDVSRQAEETLKNLLGARILVVGRDVDSGVKNLYKRPLQVGQDRLVNARAAYELCRKGAVIVDFGTALTIDVVTRNREYIGGVIAPGIEISLNVLSERAALLPRISLKRPQGLLGRDTIESMRSGTVYGFSSLCDGLVVRLKKGYCRRGMVVATGGMSRFIGPYCRTVDKIDPDLTLKGLNLIGADFDV